ncbi:MAG: hypothetical protein OEW96_06830, partial [Betaproteobacteria bacterium]|nr:hypothetical protein [Betaproteobacteria bacterium]
MTDPRKMAAPDEGREALLAAKPPVSVGQACDAAHEREIERLAATFDRYAEAAERGAVGDDPKWAEGRAAAYRRCARDVRDA